MKLNQYVAYSTAFALTFLAVLAPQGSAARGRWEAPSVVVRNCSGCHGIDGNAELPYIPRLSGQSAAYIERKIGVYQAHDVPPADETIANLATLGKKKKTPAPPPEARANMIGIAHAISAEEAQTSARWYAEQLPVAREAAKTASRDEGKNLYLQGAPAHGLIACQTCHGAQAEGKGGAPRLAGQHASYIATQLALFHAGDNHHAPEMIAVAKNLNPDQMRAVAAYLQSR